MKPEEFYQRLQEVHGITEKKVIIEGNLDVTIGIVKGENEYATDAQQLFFLLAGIWSRSYHNIAGSKSL